MTIIAWDGNRLWADRRSTWDSSDSDNFRHTAVEKIICFPQKVLWAMLKGKREEEPEYFKAVAFSGRVGHIDACMKFIEDHAEHQSDQPLRDALDRYLRQQIAVPDMTLLVLTDQKVYKFGYQQGKLSLKFWRRGARYEHQLLGSGKLAYMVIHELLGDGTSTESPYSGRQLIFMTTMTDRDLGGGIMYYDEAKNQVVDGRNLTTKEKEVLSKRMTQRMMAHSLND